MDNAWEQNKPEARKMLENAAESHPPRACFRWRLLGAGTFGIGQCFLSANLDFSRLWVFFFTFLKYFF
jgi:hypothetical protein